MEHLRKLEDLADKTAPGRTPSYTPAHILYALIFLRDNKVGRKNLAAELRLGEGTVRTMLNRLQESGLIDTDRQGVSLTEDGLRLLDSIRDAIIWSSFPRSDLTLGEHNFMVLIRGFADRVRLGVEQRDQALIHGARGATTFVFSDGGWVIPGIEQSISDKIVDHLGSFVPTENDVVVVGSGDDLFSATLGGLAAALDLF